MNMTFFLLQALLLLIQLTRNNGNIQKIVAFENAFERLFSIVDEEGNSDGGKVIYSSCVMRSYVHMCHVIIHTHVSCDHTYLCKNASEITIMNLPFLSFL